MSQFEIPPTDLAHFDVELTPDPSFQSGGDALSLFPLLERNNHHLHFLASQQQLASSIPRIFYKIGADHLILERGEFVLHCSYVILNGAALLFSGPSGIGKSTQAHLWQTLRGAEIINEDRCIISHQEGTIYANGCWASGCARICKNITAPIKAIILLGQGTENQIQPVSPVNFLCRMIPMCSFDPQNPVQTETLVDALSAVISHVPVWSYDCRMDETAVTELEQVL